MAKEEAKKFNELKVNRDSIRELAKKYKNKFQEAEKSLNDAKAVSKVPVVANAEM